VLDTDPETGRRYINEDESACFTRMYRHTKDFLGAVSDPEESDVSDCQKVIGYLPKDYGDLSDFKEEVRKKIAKKPKKRRSKRTR